MSIQTVKAGARRFVITPAHDGQIIEFGPAGTNNSVGTMTLQFKSSLGVTWSAVVVGRVFGVAADEVDLAFGPIPYRIVTLANVAQDYSIVSDTLSTDATIQVPANGMSVGVLVSVTGGTVTVGGWDMNGPSAV